MKGTVCVPRSCSMRSLDLWLIGIISALLLLAVPALGAERISSFHSEIVIQSEGVIQVTETITVVAEGRSIRRGILRDIPTRYKKASGELVRVPLTVLEVTRDGHPERWDTEGISDGIRIKIGKPKVLLEPGEHRYTISYTTERQIGFFEKYDELYWNVTGNGWAFPIQKASCTIHLPQGAEVLQTGAWTGVQGSRDQKATMKAKDTAVMFQTTHPLAAREGLTVAVSWPKGYVMQPSSEAYFLDDHGLDLGYALATVVGFVFFMVAWMFVGRDPRKGTIVPLFSPPDDLSPAAVRQIQNMGFDNRAFSAALISLAVKGYLTITQEGRLFNRYELRQTEEAQQTSPLPPEEERLYDTLFASKTVVPLKKSESETLAAAQESLSDTLSTRYDDLLYKKNMPYIVMGFSIMVVIVALSVLFFAREEEIATTTMTTIIVPIMMSVFVVVLVRLIRKARQLWNMGRGFKAPLYLIATTVVLLGGTLGLIIVVGGISSVISPICSMCLPIMALILTVFIPLMKAPTVTGRRLMDKIDGFAMYLQTTEEERLNALNPPERTPELFERYLPYALALGLEQQWSEAFETVLARAATTANGQGHYNPSWYTGTTPIHMVSMGEFASSLGQSFASAASSSAFSGGGGCSGGGGGGGGW